MKNEVQMTATRQKALAINLDDSRYGTFAEIGAGQEVVRWFFQAGGAAGTIAKSISAYDMKVSDVTYGDCARYVCQERLEAMLETEQRLTHESLDAHRGHDTAFFTFADTVSARNYHGTNECHGWMGVRFQESPGAGDSQIIVHVMMLDDENHLQQEALGMVGVNLVYGAAYHSDNPEQLISSLLDNVGNSRIQIDMIELTGPAFESVDNRIMALKLVQLGLTGAAMFGADGSVLQANQHLRKKAILVERGRFRPFTHINLDMLKSGIEEFKIQENLPDDKIVPLLEVTMHNLKGEDAEVDLQDFMSRADCISAMGYPVLVTDFDRFDPLIRYLRRCTNQRIGIAMGLPSLNDIFNEDYYSGMEGGILEAFGHLFKRDTHLFVYPMRDQETGGVRKVDDIELESSLQHLFNHLRERHCIVPMEASDDSHLDVFSPVVLKMIHDGEEGWQEHVPDKVAEIIEEKGLFGHTKKEALTA